MASTKQRSWWGKTVFKKGAALPVALAFMFASTNLVVELSAVLWVLMGRLFVLAEFVGAFVLVAAMWLLVRLTLPKSLESAARRHASKAEDDSEGMQSSHEGRWAAVASAFRMDVGMVWKELVIGFLIAGFAMALVPNTWWQALFISHGPPALRLVENAIIGPVIAMASFVCSCGNIPLASWLWSNGIGFGGVVAFIYGDLIVLPIILIYRKYYGGRAAAYITGVMFASMVLAGIAVDLLFSALELIPHGPRRPSPMTTAHFAWDYTAWLNLAAILFLGVVLLMGHRHGNSGHPACHDKKGTK